MIYPWQKEQWLQFQAMRRSDRLPHALLLNGMAGLGKGLFAEALAKAMLCEKPDAAGLACQQCHSCNLMRADTHPDIRRLQPEKEGQSIKVDQVRDIIEFVQQSALQGRARIVIIHPANQLNISAANALLKTLEEPPAGAHLILVSHQLKGLLPTIVSRCQHVNFNKPKTSDASQWLLEQGVGQDKLNLLLKLAFGAPLAALSLQQDECIVIRQRLYQSLVEISSQHGDLLKIAAEYKDIHSLSFIDLLLSWIVDVVRCQLNTSGITNEDFIQPLQQVAQKTRTESNLFLMDYLIRLRKVIQAGVVLNKQLLVESVLIKWCQQ